MRTEREIRNEFKRIRRRIEDDRDTQLSVYSISCQDGTDTMAAMAAVKIAAYGEELADLQRLYGWIFGGEAS